MTVFHICSVHIVLHKATKTLYTWDKKTSEPLRKPPLLKHVL